MFGGMDKKEMTLVFAVIGFGSVALVGLGELSSVEPNSPLFTFYLNLVFGGLAVFYVVFIHMATITYTRKVDIEKKSKTARFFLGEKSSYIFSVTLILGVLAFWLYTFAELMRAFDITFF